MSPGADTAQAQRFRTLLAARFGLRFDDSRLGDLGELLQRRAAARGVPIESYLNTAAGDDAEAGPLAEELTVGETYFFRSRDQFRAFRDSVMPEAMAAHGPGGRLSVLSAGCSSGEEAFTIAMLAAEVAPSLQVSIRAIDLNPAALRKAASGRFGAWALRETPPEMLRQWFTPQGRDMQLSERVRSAVQFDRRNLADPRSDIWRTGAYDAIFCRNVIMYFTPAVQRAVIGRMAQSLVPGGYLFLGHAETLRGLSQDFHLVHTHNTFYYKRRAAGDVAPPRHRGAATLELPPLDPIASIAADDTSWYETIGQSSRRIEALATTTRPETAAAAAPRWNLGVALDLLQRERFAEALALLARLPAEAARDPDVLLLRALLLVQTGKLAAAGEACEALLAQNELSAGAHYVLALCFEGTGDAPAAIDRYAIASHLDPLFAMPKLRRGLLLRRAGSLDEARSELDEALELLMREDQARLQLFAGGFTRAALSRLCAAELKACGVAA